MKISLSEVREWPGQQPAVLFSCAAGQGIALWMGQEEPTVDSSYDAELDVDDCIEFGRNARLGEAADGKIYSLGENVVLQGAIESVDEDGMTYLRLSADCLLMIEAKVQEVRVGNWIRLSVPFSKLELTPLGG